MQLSRVRFCSTLSRIPNAPVFASFVLTMLGLLVPARAQVNVLTYHYDNARTGQNVNETLLTPSNVNKTSFGYRFSQPVDGFVVAQPLYLANVSIPNAGTHNVVYVATLNDSVYAFDADDNTGPNAAPLWHVNFTNPSAGITTASGSSLPCQAVTMFTQSGVVGTPVIDPTSGTMYVVAKTNENGTVYHRLHALDVSTGAEKFSAPVPIQASFKTHSGNVVTLNNLHAMNRPALLLNNGILYIAFGSNGCNDNSYGWVVAYDATSLAQVGAFNTAPLKGLASIWHTGSGPAADSEGNVYVSTAEGDFNANSGGQDYGSSVLKLTENAGALNLVDYFTPYNQQIISSSDWDLTACGVMVLPDQPGTNPHVLVTSGKQGTVYLLDRDDMGQYNSSGDVQILQELTKAVGSMFSSPVYWNNTVYFNGDGHPITAYALNNGILNTTPVAKSVALANGHSPVISANGTSTGVLWAIEGSAMYAFNAVTLKTLYNTGQAGTRDVLPPQAHFATQVVANGKVYTGTQTNLMVYGLLPALSVVSGNNQSAVVTNQLSLPLKVELKDPYTGQAVSGVTLTFSDGGRGGTFSNPNPVTASDGTASTMYTFGKTAGSVTVTASNTGIKPATFALTAKPGPAKWVLLVSGGGQSAPVNTALPAPVVVKVSDQYGNGISGVGVTFADGAFTGKFSSTPVTTNTQGKASTNYTTPTTTGTVTITASALALSPLKITETATAGTAASITIIGGNNQTGPPSTQLPQGLIVAVQDQYGNPVAGASVGYDDGGAGGSFSSNPAATDTNGQASSSYTTPSATGPVGITASVGTLAANFSESVQ